MTMLPLANTTNEELAFLKYKQMKVRNLVSISGFTNDQNQVDCL